LLSETGPNLTRPYVEKVKDSEYQNMKELRVQIAGKPWRVLFAFDPTRTAVLLVGGNKGGDPRWYKTSIPIADRRFRRHLDTLKEYGQIMSIKLDDFLAELPADQRAAIKAGGAELIAEEARLRDLRKAHRRSRVELAKRLGVNQAAVSRMECRTDLYVSTLRDHVRAMGGELEIIARFPDRSPVRITQFREMKGEDLHPACRTDANQRS
jgi:hypothetical protein